MQEKGRKRTDYGLDNYGIRDARTVYWNLNTPELYEEIARRGEGILSKDGALIIDTGEHTGRAAKDKAIVREPSSDGQGLVGRSQQGFLAREHSTPSRNA